MDLTSLFELVGALLSWLYEIHPSYGFVIIGVTALALVATTPLTLKATRSMRLLRRIQPELRALQARHADDRQRLNEELRRLYREHRINPLGGCLPQLVQAPIFAALSAVLHGLIRRAPTTGSASGWVAGHHAAGVDAVARMPELVAPFDPAHLPDGLLADHLHASASVSWLDIDLAESVRGVLLAQGVPASLPHLALVAVVAVTALVHQRRSDRVPGSTPADPSQQLVAKVAPLVMPAVALTLPAGLVLYLAVTNLYRLGQFALVARTLGPWT